MRILRSDARPAVQKTRNCILTPTYRPIFLGFISLVVILDIQSCKSKVYTFSTTNFAYLYQPAELLIRPDFLLHHINDDSSVVYFKIRKEDFLYARCTTSQQFESNIQIRYVVVPHYELPGQILDSGTIYIKEPKTDITGYLVGKIPLVLRPGNEIRNYLVAITIRDINRNLEYPYFLQADRKDKFTGQYYLATDSTGNIYFEPTVRIHDKLCVNHSTGNNKKLIVRYIDAQFPIALPPFSTENESIHADDFKIIGFTDSLTGCFTFEKSGMYIFQLDSNSIEGYYVTATKSDFPLVNKRHQLVEPLRYLTTQKEFSDMQASHPDSIKYLADQFWLARAGSVERARNLVKAYYSRVQRANELFTSFKEGWKTDRGMIYIVFGPPNVVYRYSDREVWIYGDDSSALQYRFTFTRVRLPFSGFYHVLERNENYRFIWGQAVDAWRNGRIYSIKEIKREQDERDQQLRLQRYPYFWF